MKCNIGIGGVLMAVIVTFATPAAAFSAQAQATDPLSVAKALYQSADYEGALAALDQISTNAVTRDQARDGILYRALCLLALNRSKEAAQAIERLVEEEPLVRLPDDSMPPRLRALVDDVRARLAPALAHQHYKAGKTSFDAADYPKALEEFTLAIQLIDMIGERTDAALADVKVLAGGFRDLARRSIPPPPPPPSPVAEPPVERRSLEVVPPVVISQHVPEYPPTLAQLFVGRVVEGVLDVVVGENGEVKSASLVKPIHPSYDPLLLAATKRWKYQPATQGGRPVQAVKRIAVVVKGQQ